MPRPPNPESSAGTYRTTSFYHIVHHAKFAANLQITYCSKHVDNVCKRYATTQVHQCCFNNCLVSRCADTVQQVSKVTKSTIYLGLHHRVTLLSEIFNNAVRINLFVSLRNCKQEGFNSRSATTKQTTTSKTIT